MRLPSITSLLIPLALATAGNAAQFSGLYIFGDSLSDPGNNAVALGSKVSPPTNITLQSEITSNGFIPTFPYANSFQFSNGNVWAYQFATMLGCRHRWLARHWGEVRVQTTPKAVRPRGLWTTAS
ncbi:MAG: hypothetical protein ACKO3H_11560, partial [Verrucomicrobiota bacterium]